MSTAHSSHQTVLLSENEYGIICKCKSCNMYTIAYKTIVVPFSQKAFYNFEKVLRRLKADDYNLYHPQGMKASIRNYQSDLSISLTFDEVHDLLTMYRDVHLMEEIFGVLDRK